MVVVPFEVVPPVVVSERKKAMTCMDCATVAVTPRSAAKAAVTTASSAPHENQVHVERNSPVRLAASLGLLSFKIFISVLPSMKILNSVLPSMKIFNSVLPSIHLGLAKFSAMFDRKMCCDNGLSVSFTRAPTWYKGSRQAETRTSFKETKPSVQTGHAFVKVSLLQNKPRQRPLYTEHSTTLDNPWLSVT